MSCQLSSPIHAVIASAELLALDATKTQRDLTARIRASSRVLLSIVDDLVDTSRMSAGKFALRLDVVDLNDLQARVVDDLCAVATQHGVDLTRAPDPAGVQVQGDDRRLEQVLLALVYAALRLTPTGGLVRIASRGAGAEVAVTITHTGTPFPRADLDGLFDRFKQVGATWLNFGIARKIVKAHGGSLVARAERQGNLELESGT